MRASFWSSAWLQGQRPQDIAPNIFQISKNKNKSIHEGIQHKAWIRDIDLRHRNFSPQHFMEYVQLWNALSNVELHQDREDNIIWKFNPNVKFTTGSAYRAQFIGATVTNFNCLIWKVWAPPKCKFFAWLAIQNRIWTADRLQARRWPNNGVCALCRHSPESGVHLFQDCRYTRRIWEGIATWLSNEQLRPSAWVPADSVQSWWDNMDHTPSMARRGLRSIIMLVCWEIWKERNARIFEHKESATAQLLQKIKDEARVWVMAGAKHVSNLFLRA